MLLYKNGRIYNIQKRYGETRHEFLLRCWYFANTEASEAEAIAWASKKSKGCSYGSLDEILVEKQKNFTV